jgi:hypothetical protein
MGSAGNGEPTPGNMPSGNCESLDLDGMVHSPGGNVLPNGCEPFHPTTNNPYAVRCVDAWPWYQTQFPGDEYCILPPVPELGVQYGVHPQGRQWFEQVSQGDMSGYESPPDAFVMEPGQEEEVNYQTGSDNPEANFYRTAVRMRAGSHHMIVSSGDASAPQEVWGPGSAGGLRGGSGLPGAQRPDENTPRTIDKPAEDAGLYSVIPASPGIAVNLHHFNSTSSTILKEAWTNLWYEDDATVRIHGILGLPLTQVVTLNVPPGQVRDYHYSWAIPEQTRLITLFGHRHAWTPNFSSWVEHPGGEIDILYQSFDWFDMPTYRYDSLAANPAPSPETLTDGGASGITMLESGDKLHFNCHITFTDARAAAENAPSPAEIGTLTFANQAFDAEMCILFGSTSLRNLGAPANDSTPLPDFATVDGL